MKDPAVPYVAIRSRTDRLTKQEVLDCFDQSLEVGAEYPEEIPRGWKAAPEAQAVSDLAHWIVNLGPDLMWKLSVWALLTYGGKEFVKGFAAALGKDSAQAVIAAGGAVWKGIKVLARKLQRSRISATREPVLVKIVARAHYVGERLESVEIDLPVGPSEVALKGTERVIEQLILPFVAAYAAKGAPPGLAFPCMSLDEERGHWAIIDWHRPSGTQVTVEAEFGAEDYRCTFHRAQHSGRTPGEVADVVECLRELGLEVPEFHTMNERPQDVSRGGLQRAARALQQPVRYLSRIAASLTRRCRRRPKGGCA